MTEPEPKPAPKFYQRRKLFICSHRWPDGTSAWGPCVFTIKNVWISTCQRCGLMARCK